MSVQASDLAIYLKQPDPDSDWLAAAQLAVDQAVNLCQSVVDPLPSGADAVVLDVATRAFVNPTNAQSENVGPFSTSFGAVSGGLWLTRQNKATLRRLAGRGGAFTIDVMPATAAQSLPWWGVDTGGADLTDWDNPL